MTTAEVIFGWAACALYAGTTVVLVYMVAFRSQKGERLAKVLPTIAVLLHLASLVLRSLESGHIPVRGNYENASAAGLFIAAPAVAIAWRSARVRLAVLWAIPLAMFALGWALLQREAATPLTPPYRSTWLVIHVIFANLSYGGFSLACGAGIAWLLKERRERRGITGGVLDRLPDRPELDDLTFRFVVFGFVTSAMMIVAGSFWADALWGSYWNWDPVETWSLVAFLVYGLYIHLRVVHKWKGRRMAWIAVLAIVFVLISFWGVNLLEGSAHRLGVL